MYTIYWIEDEPKHVTWIEQNLEKSGFVLVKLRTVSDALNCLPDMQNGSSCILLDLYLPPGDSRATLPTAKGPELGLWLLKNLRKELGNNYPIAIFSGNLSIDTIDMLTQNHYIDLDAIFAKPLTEPETLIAVIDKWKKESTK